MIHTVSKKSDLDTAINCFFTTFKLDIVKFSNVEWKEEGIKGKSFAQYKVMVYYNLLYLLILVYKENIRVQYLNKDYSYFNDKYNLNEVKKCMACEGINYNQAINCFGLQNLLLTDNGIEDQGIEINFAIEGSINLTPINGSGATVLAFLQTPNYCVNSIN